MIVSNKYRLSKADYAKMQLYGIESVLYNLNDSESKRQYLEKIYEDIERYGKEKEWFDSLTDEEKIRVELEDIQDGLKKEIDEFRNTKYLLNHGKTVDESTENIIDTEYFKTSYILFETQEKIKLYKESLESKLANTNFNPSLTDAQKRMLIFRTIINEWSRLSTNLINYNFFLNCLSNFYNGKNKISEKDADIIKTSMLMFILVTDFENNKAKYENYQFPDFKIECIENYNSGVADRMTSKAQNREISKIIRDAASHGEFYPGDQRNNIMHRKYDPVNLFPNSSMIIIENSSIIPRIGMNLNFESLKYYVMDSVSDETKRKYPFIINIINNNINETIENINKNDIKELIVLMLNNIIQYNTEHHFKLADMSNSFNFDMFVYIDKLNDDLDITNQLSNDEKLMNVKNALGHNNVRWDNDEIILENIWNPNRGKGKHVEIKSNFNDLVMFFMQYNIYDFSTISVSSFDIYRKNVNTL